LRAIGRNCEAYAPQPNGKFLLRYPRLFLSRTGSFALAFIVGVNKCRRLKHDITIYHNPACGTSRNTLAMIRQSGEEPTVVEYLKTPPTREMLVHLLRVMGISARALLRQRGTPYAELGLGDPKWTEDELMASCLRIQS